MTVHLCSCGFATDDPGWFDGHRAQHPGHHRRGPAPRWPDMPGEPGPGRLPEVSALTTGELERARRELAASLALSRPGSPARVPILAHLAAIDAELAGRNGQQP
jgi:hypothetical protein